MAVAGFEKHLIFYQANDTELRVIRMLHSSRDIESIFKLEDEKAVPFSELSTQKIGE